jgi:broad specificity phosphatase PhoE
LTRIYLVRHADVHNPDGLIYGRLGRFRISDLGLKQAKDLSDYFKNKNITTIYASPLLRARQTAKIISDHQIPIKYSRLLTEANYTKWQGKPFSSRPVSDMNLYMNTPTLLRAGETLEEIQKRIIKKINRVLKKHKGESIIILSHADPINCARLFYEGRDLDLLTKTVIKKASINLLEFNKRLECEKMEYIEVTYAPEETP